jgi:protease-4
MTKFLIGLLTGLVLTILSLIIMAFSLFRLGERRPTIADGSTLVVSLNGDVPEKSPVEVPIPFIGKPTPLTVHEIWYSLRRAAEDPRIRAAVITTDRIDAGWAKLHEIRDALAAFKKSGKPLVAFLRGPRTREYYVATVADKIYVSPEDLLDIKGLRAELMFFKRTLDKLGVEVQVEHIGRYKDALDPFTRTAMTPETREVMDSVLDNIYADIVNVIASGRKRPASEVRSLIDEGPFTARQAARKGLVDALRYEDQVHGELRDRLKQKELKRISLRDYVRAAGSTDTGAKRRIALVVGEGAIVRGAGTDAMGTDEGFSSGAFIQMLRRVRGDNSISGVILRVDSPGGDAFASDEILREVRLLRDRKPLVISMSDSAASGGYYVSMTGDPIVAYPNTFTGSIGVIFGKLNLRGLYEKLGIEKEILVRGKNAAIDTDYGPLSPEGRLKLRQGIEEFYREFVQKVAKSRNRTYAEIDSLAQGRVWLGSQAKSQGLVDEVGGLDKAIELLKKKARIPESEKIALVPYPPKRTIFDQYLKSTADPGVETLLRRVFGGLDYRVWMRGGIMRMMPYTIEVH